MLEPSVEKNFVVYCWDFKFYFSDEEKKQRRQSYIFSATLTLVHSGPDRLMLKKKKFKITEERKLGRGVEYCSAIVFFKALRKLLQVHCTCV